MYSFFFSFYYAMARQVNETVHHVVACVAPVAAPDMGAREACEGTKRQGQVEDWPLLLRRRSTRPRPPLAAGWADHAPRDRVPTTPDWHPKWAPGGLPARP